MSFVHCGRVPKSGSGAERERQLRVRRSAEAETEGKHDEQDKADAHGTLRWGRNAIGSRSV